MLYICVLSNKFELKQTIRVLHTIMIIIDDSSIVNKLETSVTDDARVIIYDRHMFTVHATGSNNLRAELGLGSALPRGVRLGFFAADKRSSLFILASVADIKESVL